MTPRDLPAAVLWDLDGTLIDSEPYWIEAEAELTGRFGVEWSHEDALSLVGNPLPDSARILIARGVLMGEAEVIDALVGAVTARARVRIPWIPEALALLEQAREAGIPCALVTMSVGSFTDVVLAEIGHLFQAVVTGDQVVNGKPDPEGYLLAAERLGVHASDCVAIEDSAPGTGAAHASGARTVAVPRHGAVPPREGMVMLDSLAGLGVAGLGAVFRGESLSELGV